MASRERNKEPPSDPTYGGQDDVVIAVMGSTGTGKSSFVKLLSGDAHVKIGDSLQSETMEVILVPFLDRGRNVTIVDTPGFDDSRKDVTDTDVLKKIADFLLTEYDTHRKLNGLIYLQRISDPRFGGQSSRNLKMFRHLCGTRAYENVVVLTTFWDQLPNEQEGAKREEQLKTRFFDDLVEGGARFMRHDGTIESARDVLRCILTLVPTIVQIQQEIRLEGKVLEETAAGSVHREEVEKIIAKHRKHMADLKTELDATQASSTLLRREIEEERAQTQQELARWETERDILKRGLEEAKKTHESLKADVAREREDREKWRQEQKQEWKSQFDGLQKRHEESMQQLQAQVEYEKKEREREAASQVKEGVEGDENWRRNQPGRRTSKQSNETTEGASDYGTKNKFEFAYTSQYPPCMKTIPDKYQMGVFDIFNFNSLLDTTAMLFTRPELFAKLRYLAPSPDKIRNMQDLVDRNRQLHLRSRQDNQRSRDMYFCKNIGLRDDWYTDAVFGQQQFTGTNPTTLTLASRRWIDEFKTASQVQRRNDVGSLLRDDPTSMFIQDYSDFRSVMGVSSSSDFVSEGRYGCSSVALFHLEPQGRLHPLAIIIDYKESVRKSVTIFNRRITSGIRGDESRDWPWRYAKMCVQVSDWLRHEVAIHLVNTHLVEEVIIVAAHRTFEPFHIIFKLLEPHWSTTLRLNKAARETLVPKIIIGLIGFTAPQTSAFLMNAYDRFDWTNLYVPNDLRRRGFPVEDLEQVKYHNYAYARGIARMWTIIRRFVSVVLTDAYPGGDEQVATDRCLATFCNDVRSHKGGQLVSFPDINTLDELIDFATMCIHIASPQHTAVNYLQQYYQTFIPNKPSALYARPPQTLEQLQTFKEDDILLALPIRKPKNWLIMAQVPYLLSFEAPDESTILYYATTTADSASAPTVIRNAAKTLKGDLEEFIETVSQYSKELDDQETPYLVLDPSKTAISIII
ncbi:hypothetical protein APHAL10511_001412 [Amanita phalloides]|nr:hypothetical protein APHAL10511_001412 [Amanita phalloides]